jgi:hypothetical protein
LDGASVLVVGDLLLAATLANFGAHVAVVLPGVTISGPMLHPEFPMELYVSHYSELDQPEYFDITIVVDDVLMYPYPLVVDWMTYFRSITKQGGMLFTQVTEESVASAEGFLASNYLILDHVSGMWNVRSFLREDYHGHVHMVLKK